MQFVLSLFLALTMVIAREILDAQSGGDDDASAGDGWSSCGDAGYVAGYGAECAAAV